MCTTNSYTPLSWRHFQLEHTYSMAMEDLCESLQSAKKAEGQVGLGGGQAIHNHGNCVTSVLSVHYLEHERPNFLLTGLNRRFRIDVCLYFVQYVCHSDALIRIMELYIIYSSHAPSNRQLHNRIILYSGCDITKEARCLSLYCSTHCRHCLACFTFLCTCNERGP